MTTENNTNQNTNKKNKIKDNKDKKKIVLAYSGGLDT